MSDKAAEVKLEAEEDPSASISAKSDEKNTPNSAKARVIAKTGHWNDGQKLRYLMFIEYHYEKMKIKENRRLWKIFKIMAQFVKTRKASQCRSHHKKMECYFQSIPEIINYYKQRIPNYQQHYEAHQQTLKNISFGVPIKQSTQQEIQPTFHHQRNTSIRLDGQQAELSNKEDNLPKTDDAIQTHNQIIYNQPSKQKQINEYNFSLPQLQQYYNPMIYGQFNPLNYSTPPFNFFQFYRNHSSSEEEQCEWIECQRLYLVWRDKAERLMEKEDY